MAECQRCKELQCQLDNLTTMYKARNKELAHLEHSKQAAIDNLKKRIEKLVEKNNHLVIL